MKVKELKRTMNACWSPAEQYPVYIAAGSAAQQVDANFSTNSHLEIYSLNLEDPGYDLEVKSSIQTQHKFQKVVWSGAGVIVGGCDGGLLEFYSAEKLLKNSSDALIGTSSKHNGNVSALDINPYQKNLLASGASDSEIFIWDLNNTAQPMAPGNKSQPYDHVQGLAWNQQVQHILGSTFATRCVVWDLRKNEPIMKLSDSQSRSRWRALAWHPNVATQLVTASEDDLVPVLQLWDLRLAASPLATLEGHTLGALSVSWSKHDAALLLSAGKDGRVLAWDPNNTQPGCQLQAELYSDRGWVFSVECSPRVPSLFLATSFDSSLGVHSLSGGVKRENMSKSNHNNIVDSFGADSFNTLPDIQPAAEVPQVTQLPVAPKWVRRTVGAKFAFGGKLVSFEKCPQEAGPQKMVYISQVVSEPEIVEKATQLESILSITLSQDPSAMEMLAEYCRERGDAATDQSERYTWFLLRANFMPTFRQEVLNLLGYKQDEIQSKFKGLNISGGDAQRQETSGLSRGESTETEAELSTDTSTDMSDAHTLIERKLAAAEQQDVSNIVIPEGDDATSQICRALILGNFEEAVDLCLEADRVADALVIATLGGPELLSRAQQYHLSHPTSSVSVLISCSLGAWRRLSGIDARSWRPALAHIATHADDAQLATSSQMLGDHLSSQSDPKLKDAATFCYLCSMSTDALISKWNESRNNDIEGLANITELALLVRRAAMVRQTNVKPGGKLETILNEYASRLASQGCLQSALNTLEGIQHAELRDRLQYALGMHSQRNAYQPTQVNNQPRSRTVSARRPTVHDVPHYGQVPAPVPQEPAPPYWSSASQPPRVSSAGPTPNAGITSRSKYKVDPSVQSAPLYNQYSFNNPPQNFGGYNSPLPDQYSNSSVPAPMNASNMGHSMGQNSGQIGPSSGPLGPSVGPNSNLGPMGTIPQNNPIGSVPMVPNLNTNSMGPNTNAVNNYPVPSATMNGGSYNPLNNPSNVEPAIQAPLKPAAPGWNDPPMLTSSKPKPKPEVQAQAPITHPLFGVEPPQHVPLNPQYPGQSQFPGQSLPGQSQFPGQSLPGQQSQFPGQSLPGQNQFPGLQNQFPGQSLPGQSQFPAQSQFSAQSQLAGQQYPGYQEYSGQFGVNQGYPAQSASPAPLPVPEPVQKAAIPEQHLVLQEIFDRLSTECSNRAANPQMKRKLEDVQKKLEALYDLLREYRLSEQALSSLHNCAQLSSSGDYEAAMQVATSLAQGTDFASAAAFLPGLKVLFSSAQQLQVFLQ